MMKGEKLLRPRLDSVRLLVRHSKPGLTLGEAFTGLQRQSASTITCVIVVVWDIITAVYTLVELCLCIFPGHLCGISL